MKTNVVMLMIVMAAGCDRDVVVGDEEDDESAQEESEQLSDAAEDASESELSENAIEKGPDLDENGSKFSPRDIKAYISTCDFSGVGSLVSQKSCGGAAGITVQLRRNPLNLNCFRSVVTTNSAIPTSLQTWLYHLSTPWGYNSAVGTSVASSHDFSFDGYTPKAVGQYAGGQCSTP